MHCADNHNLAENCGKVCLVFITLKVNCYKVGHKQ